MLKLRGKTLLWTALFAMLIPVTPILANSVSSWSTSDAVERILQEDLNLRINATDPDLSDSTLPYQSRYADDLELIQDAAAEYQEKSKQWQTELAAYSLLHNYHAASRSYELAEAQRLQALEQLQNMLLQKEQGLVSEMDVKRAELSYNQTASSTEDVRQQYEILKMQVNQKLGNPLEDELYISLTSATLLDASEYDADTVFAELKDNHASLAVAQKTVEVYNDILNSVDNATVVGGRTMGDQIEDLDEQRIALEQTYASLPDGDPEKEEVQTQLLGVLAQLNALEEQLSDAKKDRNRAVDELEEYYKELLEESELNLQMQIDNLELVTYQYEEKFTTAARKLKLARENAELADELYLSANRMYEQGLSTFDDVESARISLLNAQMQLFNLEAEYASLKIEFDMFKEGYLPSGM